MWGARVASPNENFPAVRPFTKQLASQIKEIEKKAYTISGVQITFSFELVPSDMKFLCFLRGDLSNSASYFSSFANVSKADCTTLNGKFGNMPNCKWKPWPYRQRLDMAKQGSKFKDKISPNLARSTQRSKVTQFIASKKSRQEFEPLIGTLCDKEVVKPLHLKNNGVQHLQSMLLALAISLSNIQTKSAVCQIYCHKVQFSDT